MNINQVWIDAIKMYAKQEMGEDVIEVESNDDDTRIHLSGWNHSLFTFYTSEGQYIINLPSLHKNNDFRDGLVEIKQNSMELFWTLLFHVFEKEIKPLVLNLYQCDYIKKLPKGMKEPEVTYDFSKITVENFTSIFHESTEDRMNGETVENVRIQPLKGGLEIIFDVDCDRYGLFRDYSLTISDRGYVRINLPERIEGCGIEIDIKEKLLELITNEKQTSQGVETTS